MKRRTLTLDEAPGSSGRSFLAESGDYFIEEKLGDETTGRLGRFSYMAATVLASKLEQAVDDFIEDNACICYRCATRWIVLDDLPFFFCPRCDSRQPE